MGGEKRLEHREDGHAPPPGGAGATALASARDCRSCARWGGCASLHGLKSTPWGGGPRLLATEMKEAFSTASFGTVSTSGMKLMVDEKDSSKNSESTLHGPVARNSLGGG